MGMAPMNAMPMMNQTDIQYYSIPPQPYVDVNAGINNIQDHQIPKGSPKNL
jgi:hypothetical protein